VLDSGGKEKNIMKNSETMYTDAPRDVDGFFDALERGEVKPLTHGEEVALGIPSPEELAKFRRKKRINIMLNVQTIERFKEIAAESNGRYQTIIGDVLDDYSRRY
jgi:hypothetical protein